VIGLLTDTEGEPLAVSVFEGINGASFVISQLDRRRTPPIIRRAYSPPKYGSSV
jgi:hypothetical protein